MDDVSSGDAERRTGWAWQRIRCCRMHGMDMRAGVRARAPIIAVKLCGGLEERKRRAETLDCFKFGIRLDNTLLDVDSELKTDVCVSRAQRFVHERGSRESCRVAVFGAAPCTTFTNLRLQPRQATPPKRLDKRSIGMKLESVTAFWHGGNLKQFAVAETLGTVQSQVVSVWEITECSQH